MDFGLSEDQELFVDALRGYLAEHVPVTRVRDIMESDLGADRALFAQLAGQGVTGILVPAEHGGTELGLLEAAVAAQLLGEAAVPVSFHSACVMAPLAILFAGNDALSQQWLGPVAAGEAILSYVTDGVTADDDSLSGRALFVPDTQLADAFVFRARTGSGSSLHVVPRDAPGLTIETLDTVDTTRRVGELVLDGVQAERVELSDAAFDRVEDAGCIALAADALGAADHALEIAIKYSLERKQFERVIGSFQAVKHMCAETAAEVEPLRSLMWYTAFAWDEQREDSRAMAALLKAHATEIATTATTTCVQVFGGMGFTWECDVHLWFKRAGYDRQMLGGPAALRERAAAAFLQQPA